MIELLDGRNYVRHCMCMQAMLAPLHQGMSQGDVIHEKDSRGLLDFVMGSAFGKGILFTFILFNALTAESSSRLYSMCGCSQLAYSICWCMRRRCSGGPVGVAAAESAVAEEQAVASPEGV